MESLAERARQALGVGQDSFVPSSLEAQAATLKELEVFEPPLRQLLKGTEEFGDDTKGFLEACATYLTDVPFPRLWLQPGPTEPAVPAHTPMPASHAALFDADVHASFADAIPATVNLAIDKELVGPLKQWLLALDVAKDCLAALEAKRLSYDATRRSLVNEAAHAAAATSETLSAQGVSPAGGATAGAQAAAAASRPVAATAAPVPAVTGSAGQQQSGSTATGTAGDKGAAVAGEEGQQPQAQVTVVMGGVRLAQLQEDTAAKSVLLSEFESDAEVLADTLDWLVGGAARLKALLADAAGSAAAAAQAWSVPEGLLPPLPETTHITPDVEVTVRVSEAPLGALTGGAPAGTSSAAKAPPRTGSSEAGSTTSDSSSSCSTSGYIAGGGTVVKAASSSSALAPPDLSKILPSDDMVYGGGVAPSQSELSASPPGGGVAALIRDTLRPPAAEADTATDTAPGTAPGTAFGTAFGTAPGAVSADAGADLSAGDAAGATAPEVLDRAPHPYSSGGSRGQYESRLTDEAAALGLGWAQRRMSSALGEAEVAAAAAAAGMTPGPGLAMRAEVQIPDADKKQLSTVVMPTSQQHQSSSTASPAAAVAAAPSAQHTGDEQQQQQPVPASDSPTTTTTTAFSSNISTQPLQHVQQQQQPATTGMAKADEGGHGVTSVGGVSAAGPKPAHTAAARTGSGLMAAIARTLQEAGHTPASASHTVTGHQTQQQRQQQQQHARGGADQDDGSSTTSLVSVQPVVDPSESFGAESVNTGAIEGAGTTGASGTMPDGQQHQGDAGSRMHIGPEPPLIPGSSSSSSDAAAATAGAMWFKGPTRPGGAAAAGPVGSSSSTPADNDAAAAAAAADSAATAKDFYSEMGAMHVGPQPPVSTEAPAGSSPGPVGAVWVKGPTPPGGALAASGTDSSSSSPDTSEAAPAAQSVTGAAGVAPSPAGPDLSKILPSYQGLPATGASSARPAGGGVGAFIRDTLLGPADDSSYETKS